MLAYLWDFDLPFNTAVGSILFTPQVGMAQLPGVLQVTNNTQKMHQTQAKTIERYTENLILQ